MLTNSYALLGGDDVLALLGALPLNPRTRGDPREKLALLQQLLALALSRRDELEVFGVPE